MERQEVEAPSMAIPIIKKEWLARYHQILRPGKYKLRSARNVTRKDVVTDPSGNEYYDMIFNAVTLDRFNDLRQLFREKDEVSRAQFSDVLLHVTVNINGRGYSILPLRNETLDVVVDYVVDQGGIKRLTALSFRVEDAEVPETIDSASMFGPAAEDKAEIVKEALEENEREGVLETH